MGTVLRVEVAVVKAVLGVIAGEEGIAGNAGR